MKSLARWVALLSTLAKGVVGVIQLTGRWLGSDSRPDIVLGRTHPASWGTCELPLSVQNLGSAPAKKCRYCRYQGFSMLSAGPKPTMLTVHEWYASNAFALPPDGTPANVVAHVTNDVWPHIVLQDVIDGATASGIGVHAIVCQDGFGKKYRFWMRPNGENHMDVWRDSPFDGLLHRHPPEWSRWTDNTSPVTEAEWTYSFS